MGKRHPQRREDGVVKLCCPIIRWLPFAQNKHFYVSELSGLLIFYANCKPVERKKNIWKLYLKKEASSNHADAEGDVKRTMLTSPCRFLLKHLITYNSVWKPQILVEFLLAVISRMYVSVFVAQTNPWQNVRRFASVYTVKELLRYSNFSSSIALI